MKKFLGFLVAVAALPIIAYGFSGATNQVWSAPDMTGSNYVAEITGNGNIKISGSLTSASATIPANTVGTLTVQTNETVGGTLAVTGAVTAAGAATVRGATTLNTLSATGAVTAATTLGVTGVATLTATPVLLDGLTVNTNATIGGTLSVTGATTLVGGIIGGASITQTFYTVAADTAGCITNVVIAIKGVVTSGTQAP